MPAKKWCLRVAIQVSGPNVCNGAAVHVASGDLAVGDQSLEPRRSEAVDLVVVGAALDHGRLLPNTAAPRTMAKVSSHTATMPTTPAV
jgi:hypothetical protein